MIPPLQPPQKNREERAKEYRKVIPKLQLFTTPTDKENYKQEIEEEMGDLSPEALAKVLTYLKTAKKDKEW